MLDLIRPKNIHQPKMRLGQYSDGGYVVSRTVLEKCSGLFTYGVGPEIGYELDFVGLCRKPVHMFDHTIGKQTQRVDYYLHFYNEGLGFEKGCDDFIEHYNKIGLIGPVLVKIDIEGAEYEYFKKVDLKKFASLTAGLIIEAHWLHKPKTRDKFFKMVKSLSKYFTLHHIHGNNCSPYQSFTMDGHEIPDVLELSFVNKNLIEQEEPDTQPYPIMWLDVPNNMHRPDYELTYINSK